MDDILTAVRKTIKNKRKRGRPVESNKATNNDASTAKKAKEKTTQKGDASSSSKKQNKEQTNPTHSKHQPNEVLNITKPPENAAAKGRPRGRPKGSLGKKKREGLSNGLTGINPKISKPRSKGSTYVAVIGRVPKQAPSERVDMNAVAKIGDIDIVPHQPTNLEDRITSTQNDVNDLEEFVSERQTMIEKTEKELNEITQSMDVVGRELQQYGDNVVNFLSSIPSLPRDSLNVFQNSMSSLLGYIINLKTEQRRITEIIHLLRVGNSTDHQNIIKHKIKLQHLAADSQTRFYHFAFSALESDTNPDHHASLTGQDALLAWPF